MASTYDYTTRQMTFDFHLVRKEEVCKLPYSTPARVGAWSCQHCRYNGGSLTDWNAHDIHAINSYVKCKHPDAVNSEDTESVWWRIHEDFEHEALCALDG
jgi:hypothetical protein